MVGGPAAQGAAVMSAMARTLREVIHGSTVGLPGTCAVSVDSAAGDERVLVSPSEVSSPTRWRGLGRSLFWNA